MVADLIPIPNVPIFEIGTHRKGQPGEKTYTPDDLRDIVRNFQLYQSGKKPFFRPPCVIGHKEDQSLDKNSEDAKLFSVADSGTPRYGSPTTLRTDGQTLYADLDEVPRPIADLIRNGQYDSVSSEIYDAPPQGVPGQGKMLRRVAFLGGDLPELKTMHGVLRSALPAKYSEPRSYRPWTICHTRTVSLPGGVFQVFSELVPMSKSEILEKLGKTCQGLKVELFKDVPETALGEFARFAEEESKKDVIAQSTMGNVREDDDMERLRGEMKKYSDFGHKKYGRRFAEHCAKKFGEDDNDEFWKIFNGAAKSGYSRDAAAIMAADKAGDAYGEKFSEERKAALKELAEAKRISREVKVSAFCEKQLQAGTVIPAMMDRSDGEPNLADILCAAPDSPTVAKYSEGGKDKEVSFNLYGALTHFFGNKMPNLIKFGERFKAGDGTNAPPEEAEVEKVKQHYYAYSEQFRRINTTEADFVDAFKIKRKQDPELTAEKFLNVRGG